MKKIVCIITFIVSLLSLTGCSNQETEKPLSETDFYFDTVVTITLYDTQDTDILKNCFDICKKYENLFSKTIATSDISILNRDKRLEVTNPDTLDIIKDSLYYSELSEGKFDITTSTLSDLWNITGDNPKVPSQTDITNALTGVDYHNINIDGNVITLTNPGTSVDLGAIAKGYIADRLKEYLLSQNVHSAIIDLGGNILLVGDKPDGKAFSIGIQKPFTDRNETIAVVKASDISIVSSGSYERYFYQDDKLYHHILDPATGYPVDNSLTSVTIISNASVDGDGLSTSCFVLGPEKGMKLIESLENIEAVFIDKDNNISLSSGLTMKDGVITIKK